MVLRILPLVSAGVALYFFVSLAKRYLAIWLVLAMTLYMGSIDIFVRYATEYKQYMTDLAVVAFLVYFAGRYEKVDRSNVIYFLFAFSVSIWLSMPAVFVIGSILCYYGIRALKGQQSWTLLLGVALVAIINFVAEYFLILQPAMSTSHMQNFHDEFFINPKLWQADAISHNIGLVVSELRMAVGKSGISIGAAVLSMILGLYSVWSSKDEGVATSNHERRKLMMIIGLPIVFAMAASSLGKYSVLARLMLFSLPLMFLWMGLGIQYLIDQWGKSLWSRAVLFVVSLGLLVGYADKNVLSYAWNFYHREDNRSALLHIADHSLDVKAPIICTNLAVSAYDYYVNVDRNYTDLSVGEMLPLKADANLANETMTALEEYEEVWILATHKGESELDRIGDQIAKVATIKNSYRAKRSIAILASQ